MKNVLIGVTGSVATIKLQHLLDLLQEYNVKIIATKASKIFIKDVTHDILTDEDEWKDYKLKDPILHIELRNWADLLLIAPLSANTMAKIANGICDNLLTCVIRAWDMSSINE